MDKKNKQFSENENEAQEKEYYGVGSFIWEVVKVFFWALVIIIPIRVFLFQPFFVQGASMEPNFYDGDYLIVNEIGYKKTKVDLKNIHFFTVDAFRVFERGDVVVFRYPKNPEQFFIKRIIALPGEKVEVAEGRVKIYNEENPEGFFLDENNYLSGDFNTKNPVIRQIKEDEYFVMGDNRDASHDSRVWGPISKDDVVGRALFRAWPVPKIEIF